MGKECVVCKTKVTVVNSLGACPSCHATMAWNDSDETWECMVCALPITPDMDHSECAKELANKECKVCGKKIAGPAVTGVHGKCSHPKCGVCDEPGGPHKNSADEPYTLQHDCAGQEEDHQFLLPAQSKSLICTKCKLPIGYNSDNDLVHVLHQEYDHDPINHDPEFEKLLAEEEAIEAMLMTGKPVIDVCAGCSEAKELYENGKCFSCYEDEVIMNEEADVAANAVNGVCGICQDDTFTNDDGETIHVDMLSKDYGHQPEPQTSGLCVSCLSTTDVSFGSGLCYQCDAAQPNEGAEVAKKTEEDGTLWAKLDAQLTSADGTYKSDTTLLVDDKWGTFRIDRINGSRIRVSFLKDGQEPFVLMYAHKNGWVRVNYPTAHAHDWLVGKPNMIRFNYIFKTFGLPYRVTFVGPGGALAATKGKKLTQSVWVLRRVSLDAAEALDILHPSNRVFLDEEQKACHLFINPMNGRKNLLKTVKG